MVNVVYHSIDFDGCFSNEKSGDTLGLGWTTALTKDQVNQAYLTANADFLNRLSRGDKTVILVGSNRQDPYIDFSNGSGSDIPSGSVYPVMEAIAENLNATFDSFLLPDLAERDGPKKGETYKKFKEKGYLNANGSYKVTIKDDVLLNSSIFDKDGFSLQQDDESKVSLVFAQMQLAAMENPNDQVEFNFYDDRKDIMEGLIDFFKKNPELIPKNVKLNCVNYSGPPLTQQQAQQYFSKLILHTSTDLTSEQTKKLKQEAKKNNFPLLIKIPGEKEATFKLYRRNLQGEWGFEDIKDIDGLTHEELSKKFPKEGERSHNNASTEGKIVSYLKTRHFLPISSNRNGSKPAYDYGEPKTLFSIQGEGSIPTTIYDWLPAYKALREVAELYEYDEYKISVAKGFTQAKFAAHLPQSKTGILTKQGQDYVDLMIEKKFPQLNSPDLTLPGREELESTLIELYKAKVNSNHGSLSKTNLGHIDAMIASKTSTLNGGGEQELTADERSALESTLIELYKIRIKINNAQLLSKEISIVHLKQARNELCQSISDALQLPELTIKECQDMESILKQSTIATDPKNHNTEAQFKAITALGNLSEEVGGKASQRLGSVAEACGMLAIVAAVVTIALSATGIGLIVGLAVTGALALTTLATGISAKATETNLGEKSRLFKGALEQTRNDYDDAPITPKFNI